MVMVALLATEEPSAGLVIETVGEIVSEEGGGGGGGSDPPSPSLTEIVVELPTFPAASNALA